jgi:hypothetical protein
VPVVASNTRAEPSALAVATRVPSGANATALTTQLSWSKRTSSAPVAASNTRAERSRLAVASRLPRGAGVPARRTRITSGANVTARTSP